MRPEGQSEPTRRPDRERKANGLRCITSIGGDLSLTRTDFKDLDAIDQLDSIGGDLVLSDNAVLADISALRTVTLGGGVYLTHGTYDDLFGLGGRAVIHGDLVLDNVNVASLEDLDELEDVEGDVVLANMSLLNLTGLEALDGVDSIEIRNMWALEDLTGLTAVHALHHLVIDDNPSLLSLDGSSLIDATGGVQITGNSKLETLDGWQIRTVDGDIDISDNPALNSLSGLTELINVFGSLRLSDLPLTDLTGLEELNQVGIEFRLEDLDSLRTLNGLGAFNTSSPNEISLVISDNDALIDISALAFLTGTVSSVEVTRNPMLPNLRHPSVTEVSDGRPSPASSYPRRRVGTAFAQSVVGGVDAMSNRQTDGRRDCPAVVDARVGV